MNKPAYHHGDLKDALLRRAVDVINAEGVEALSLRSLARDLDVSHAAPARHFASRSELLATIASYGAEALVAATDAALGADEGDPIERLRIVARAYMAWTLDHPAHHQALNNPDVMRHADQRLKDRLVDFAARQRGRIVEAQAVGWKRDVPTDVAMFQLVAFVSGAALVTSDPIYKNVLRDVGDTGIIDQAIDAFFVDPRG